ncbi:MAG TPA: hypothetical protein VKF17_20175, partial [Isosphaeraceae bacterium]|nr:hypothetical protein [Isosphaeraceae bacterium]
HIREAQPLSLAFAAQARQGLDQFRISDRRVFLSISFDVSGQLVLILASLALGSTRLDGGSLLGGQLGVTQSAAAPVRVRRSLAAQESFLDLGGRDRSNDEDPGILVALIDHDNRLTRGRLADHCRTP